MGCMGVRGCEAGEEGRQGGMVGKGKGAGQEKQRGREGVAEKGKGRRC